MGSSRISRALAALPLSGHGAVLALLLVVGAATYWAYPDQQGRRGGVARLDGYYYYIYLRSVQTSGDLDFSDEYRDWGNPFGFGRTAAGRARNIFGVGPALVWTPTFLVAEAAAHLGRSLGLPIERDGLSRFHQRITFFASLIYGWLAVLLSTLIARELFGRSVALWAALGAALAGPLPYYCLHGASYAHAPAAAATSLAVWLWVRWRDRWTTRRFAALGSAIGLAVLIRPACAPLSLLLAWETVRALRAARATARRDPDRAPSWRQVLAGPLAAAGCAALVFAPQIGCWRLLYGRWLIVPQGRGFLWWSSSEAFETLFSPRNGLLTSAPLMVAALCGLVLLALRRRRIGLPLALVFCATLLLNGAVHDWWGWGFSARRYTSALPLLTVGLGCALESIHRWLGGANRAARALTATAVLAAVVFNLQWMHMYTRDNLRWYQLRSSQALYMSVLHGLVDRVYRVVGNPLSLPAAVAFSWRHDRPLRDYDRLSGSYLLGEVNPPTNPSADPYLQAALPLAAPRLRPNLSEAFAGTARDGDTSYAILRRLHGDILLPLNRPGSVKLRLRARAVRPGTRVELRFNGRALGVRPLSPDRWTAISAEAPASVVRRGINRLDLIHHMPPQPEPTRAIGSTGVVAPRDVAAISGGVRGGRFCELWLAGHRLPCERYGINVALIDSAGELLDQRGFAVADHPVLYRHLARYLRRFPRGTIVLLATRGRRVGRYFGGGAGAAALAAIGARTDLAAIGDGGYAAIGAIGAPPGTALEAMRDRGHARRSVGRVPPPWQQVAHYSALVLR